jgi:inhibitor of KinA sporulation pathway (predicted exonuclease)
MIKDLINNIDFKELSKSCKDERDLSNLTKEFMKDLKKVYKAPTKNAAEIALDKLEEKWGKKISNSYKFLEK